MVLVYYSDMGAQPTESVEMKRIIVVGNGMVGHKFAELAVKQETNCTIEIFSEEPRPAYDRVRLSSFFSGTSDEELLLATPEYYESLGIKLHLSSKISKINRKDQTVLSSTGKFTAYDALILATGSYPFVPPIPGKDQEHCHVYRTIDDLEGMQASSEVSKVGVVIGGGLLGLEAANALKNMGLETHIVEFAPHLMSVQIDEQGGRFLREKVEALGVHVHTGKNTTSIVPGETCRYRLTFSDDESIEADMIVFSAGIRPRDEIAKASELMISKRGGVAIDEHCRSSDSSIYAIGECASLNDACYGLVAPGYEMAKVAADHILGTGKLTFRGADMSTKLKLLGIDVASLGDAHGVAKGAQILTYANGPGQEYKRLIVNKTGKRLLGAVLIGDVEQYGMLHQTMLNELVLPKNPEALILPKMDSASSMNVTDLPDTAQICSCHDISKGQILEAVTDGATTLGSIKTCTKAGTGCGGCSPMVERLLHAKLKTLGVEIDTDLCEHFSFTRQELYHLVRVEQIKSFRELLKSHGKGLGCDICKPTVASILASCWNKHVLEPELAGLQDTNDHFLANLQKDGTYSIVPRIPGGEITPDKLIVLGQVAKKFDLYTKITGAQRVDMFGASVDQLPEIWSELVEAGFETGHAYGKAVRTVKSCVGNSWCRYGVLDSVSMAVFLENRYKGLRAPHKLKFAVSGCIRECAEAQSKDVGVIATDNGWNLYVSDNGGMRPRHADLFATGLGDESLVQLIDRFLMFYVRTADRLQRTSVWLESLEGGLDYLKEVIIDDSLQICEELEQEMANVITSYKCEWKATINDPQKLKRFKTFINSDVPDPTLRYVRERGQRRPAKPHETPEIVAVERS